jgi:putative methionine-R-sulfoxide reductase with GAF domain
MKLVFRSIAMIAIILYLLGLFALGYLWLNNPNIINDVYDLLSKTPDYKHLNALMPWVHQVIISIYILGIVAFLMLILSSNPKIDVVYINETKENIFDKLQHPIHQTTNGEYQNGSNTKISIDTIEDIIRLNQYNKKQLLEGVLQRIAILTQSVTGAIYIAKSNEESKTLEMAASYAFVNTDNRSTVYDFGKGLVGQVGKNGKPIKINNIPKDYIQVVSGLGKSSPSHLFIFPIKNDEEEVLGVIEIASFTDLTTQDETFLNQVALLLAKEIETNEYQNLLL